MITILTTDDGAKLAKRLTRTADGWSKEAYDEALTFDITVEAVHDIDSLSAVLTAIEDMPHSCVIRGRKIAGRGTEGVRRLLHDRPGKLATFEDYAASWVMIDVDDLPVDPNLTNTERLQRIVDVLPTPFQGVDFHYQWSSSAGLGDWSMLRCHLFFWLAKPLRSSLLRQQADAEDWACDLSLFNPVQVHYTAAPIFTNAEDPLTGFRSGLVRGNRRAVELPAWSAPKAPVAGFHTSTTRSSSYDACLAAIGPDYHLPILRAAKRYVQENGVGADIAALRSDLIDTIMSAPPGKNPKKGYMEARYLDRVINGAVMKFANDPRKQIGARKVIGF